MLNGNKKKAALNNTVLVSMLVSVFTVCAYVHVPFTVPFTLQTFALALCLELTGVLNTLKMLLIYVLLGFAGLPVFSSFRGGIAAMSEPSGGFIIGFFAMTALYALLRKVLPSFKLKQEVCLVMSLTALYACGSLWYTFVYLPQTNGGFISSLAVCVIPYVFPDVVKVILGRYAAKRLCKYIKP